LALRFFDRVVNNCSEQRRIRVRLR
jgi:hypothetical protein